MQSCFQQSLYVFFFFLREVLVIQSMKFMDMEDSSLRRAALWSTLMYMQYLPQSAKEIRPERIPD
jgi:hypothetical protein